jgi:hypothetical protein
VVKHVEAARNDEITRKRLEHGAKRQQNRNRHLGTNAMSGIFGKRYARLRCGANNPRRLECNMSNDPNNGKGNPYDQRQAIVEAAADMYCTVCGGRPCYLLATAALAVMQDTLRVNEDLVSTVRSLQAYMKVQRCLEKHLKSYLYITNDIWGLDSNLEFTEGKLKELMKNGEDVRQLQAVLLKETQFGGPQLTTS